MTTQSKMRRLRRTRRGNSALELAIAASLLLHLFLGVADFGRVFYTAIEVTNAADAGALWGAQNVGRAGDIDGMIRAARADAPEVSNMSVTASKFCTCPNGNAVACSPSACGSGVKTRYYVRVTTQKTFQTLARYPGVPSSSNITKTTTLRVQ